jgi:polysaccharide export outer membrane protein
MTAARKMVSMKKAISKNNWETCFVMTRWLMSMLAILFFIAGCATDESLDPNFPQTSTPQISKASDPLQKEPLLLQEGDVVNISFPGSSSLNTTQQIRRDGKIVIPLIGEVTAAGMTPVQLQDDLIKKYAPQVATKQIIVTIQSSTYPVYVSGAVLPPGPVQSDRPLSVLDAIMEAGGYDTTKANLKAVVVVRQGPEGTTKFKLNLDEAMKGAKQKPFILQPSDIVFVPEKFTWF